MPQRTISEAQEALQSMVLSPKEQAEREREIEEVRARYWSDFEREHEANYDALGKEIRTVRRSLTRVTRALEELDEEGEHGAISAAEFRERFRELSTEHQTLQERLGTLDGSIDQFRAVDRDILGALDERFEKYPMLRPHFSF